MEGSPSQAHGGISIKWFGEGSAALGASMSHHLLCVSSLSIEAHGAQIRYDVHKLHGKVDPALKEKLKQNNVTLESEYEKLEQSDLDNWENIRGPQLWEDSRAVQKQRREAARLKTE